MQKLLAVACSSLALAATQVSCSQPPVACTVSSSGPYAAKYQLVEGDGPCAELSGDLIGMQIFSASDGGEDPLPDLSKASLAIRTDRLGSLAAHARDHGVVDETEGHAPHAFGPLESPFPDENNICTPDLAPAQQTLAAVENDEEENPEDPGDDIAQPAVEITESWSDVQVYVTAAALGTQMKARYVYADAEADCRAEYDVLALFPAVHCEAISNDGDPNGIASINDDGPDGAVTITTDTDHGLAVGDSVKVQGVDAGDFTYDGTYTVATVVDGDTFITAELDPFGSAAVEPNGEATSGTIQKLSIVPDNNLCNPLAQPDKGIPVGSGISPDFPVVCDPELLLCVLDAEPSSDTFPVLQ